MGCGRKKKLKRKEVLCFEYMINVLELKSRHKLIKYVQGTLVRRFINEAK
jgi:hypothetical protein